LKKVLKQEIIKKGSKRCNPGTVTKKNCGTKVMVTVLQMRAEAEEKPHWTLRDWGVRSTDRGTMDGIKGGVKSVGRGTAGERG